MGELAEVVEIVSLVNSGLPLLSQGIADVKAAIAVKKDPAAELTALQKIAADVQADIVTMTALLAKTAPAK